MGNVVMGNYPISLSSWAFTLYRSHVIDHVDVIKGDTYAMFAIPTLPENDFGFFFRGQSIYVFATISLEKHYHNITCKGFILTDC